MTDYESIASDNIPALDPDALKRREHMMGYGHAVVRTDPNGGRYVVVEEYNLDETNANFDPVDTDSEIV
ncbi:hypothetical protein HYU82_02610 [Candidatus Saccharibacteria bacterium]|nr:hypothetical protein [Candidatus Saccharibacteria bacterium]